MRERRNWQSPFATVASAPSRKPHRVAGKILSERAQAGIHFLYTADLFFSLD